MAGGWIARYAFFLPAEIAAYPATDSTFEHVLNSTGVGKIGLPADIALDSKNMVPAIIKEKKDEEVEVMGVGDMNIITLEYCKSNLIVPRHAG